MSEHIDIIQRAADHVFTLFKEKLPNDRIYHNYAHTVGVAEMARKIAKGMKLGEDAVEVVTLAGWFHDAGYTEAYKGHEDLSKRIATEFLRENNYPEQKIDIILGCIEATRMPQKPQNLLEEIICDADLSSIGKRSFFETSVLLRIEWEKALGQIYTNEEWNAQDLDFLSRHTFHTKFAQLEFGEQQSENIRIADKIIRKREAIITKERTEEEKPLSQIDDPAQDQGIIALDKWKQNVNNLASSSQNDRSAQTMLLANSLLISSTIGFVIPLSVARHEFAIPGFFLVFVCVLSMLYSILSLRLQQDQVKTPERNSQYFRISTNIFMCGVIISIILFLIAFLTPKYFCCSTV